MLPAWLAILIAVVVIVVGVYLLMVVLKPDRF